MPCERVGRVMLNEVMTCADESRERGDRLALISTGSRGSIPFINQDHVGPVAAVSMQWRGEICPEWAIK